MLNKLFWGMIALFFPWLVLLLDDNPGGALVALIMQATIIGWLPATFWAWRIIKQNTPEKTKKKSKKD